MASTTTILLRNATILVHDDNLHVQVLRSSDILIEDGLISAIGSDLASPSESCEVVDCTDCIITPGLISTHSHLWQSQLKGRFTEDTLFDYMPKGNFQGYNYTPSDIFLGQLAGCLEHIDAGTTTVLDHAHGAYSVQHIEEAIKATQMSGIRATHAYAETFRLDKWDSELCVPSQDLFNEDRIAFLESQAKALNSQANSKVHIGWAFDQWYMPPQFVQAVFGRMLNAGVRTFTAHIARNAVFGMRDQVQGIEDSGVLDLSKVLQSSQETKETNKDTRTNFVLSHCTAINASDEAIITRPSFSNPATTDSTFLSISCTPDTESQMGMHRGAAFASVYTPDLSQPSHQPQVSLGVDCHCSSTTFMPALARLALQNARILANDALLQRNKWPSKLRGDSEGVFNMMTVNGANGLGLGSSIGRIKVGYKADLVVFNATSTGIAAAAEYDPLIAAVRFSDVRDVEHVLVDGQFKKRDGKLLPVNVDGQSLGWEQIRKQLISSQREIGQRINNVSMDKAAELMVGMFQIDRGVFE